MARPATTRIKFNPPVGTLPVLQYCPPERLSIDDSYQRSLAVEASRRLVREIAQHWNWDLCQPLVVARRPDGGLFVIDGQHRRAAAMMRGDIAQLPCVVVEYANTAAEAASFVHLNQRRRPLAKLDVFKAAIASEDPEACAIVAALEDARLSIAPHQNYVSWKPAMIANVGGLQAAWRVHGPEITSRALVALRIAFAGQVLRYAGTIFPGLVAICAAEMAGAQNFEPAAFEAFCKWAGARSQEDWRSLILRFRADNPGFRFADAGAAVFNREWRRKNGATSARSVDFAAFADGKAWCEQCDMLVSRTMAEGCTSRFCPFVTKGEGSA